jgi:hypothetical protein
MNKEQKNIKSFLFNNYVNDNSKTVPFNTKENKVGNIKYFPATSKEWKNTTFSYNVGKHYPIYNQNINKLIQSYFNLYFENTYLKSDNLLSKFKRTSLNKIFVSKAEIKHTNSKAIITIYVYNRERLVLLKKIRSIKKTLKTLINNRILLKNSKTMSFSESILSNRLNNKLYKELLLLKKYRLKLQANKFKFEGKFLYKLAKLISKIYNKKIEFNIVNLKSIIFNTDLFTEILSAKIKNNKSNVLRMMSIILNRAVLLQFNRIKEKSKIIKSVDFNLKENKYKYLNINSIIRNNLSKLLSELYYNNYIHEDSTKLDKNLFDSINYKNLLGIRLEVKGRLTRRYRADRAIFKVKWKGGLKNIDSSYKELSAITMRGYEKSNVEYSIFTSKRRIGAFAVKGWISGK